MRKTGTVISFSVGSGFGHLRNEEGERMRFESSEVKWRRDTSPVKGQRLTYETSTNGLGEPRAVDLQSA